MKTGRYIDWAAVCRQPNTLLQMLVISCDNDTIRSGLERGFPELYCDKETRICVPMSVIRQMVLETEAGTWGDVLSELDIPRFLWGDSSYAVSEQVPENWCEYVMQVIKKDGKDGSYVFLDPAIGLPILSWRNTPCIVVEAVSYDWITIEKLVLIPMEFVDLGI